MTDLERAANAERFAAWAIEAQAAQRERLAVAEFDARTERFNKMLEHFGVDEPTLGWRDGSIPEPVISAWYDVDGQCFYIGTEAEARAFHDESDEEIIAWICRKYDPYHNDDIPY
jgi:hypothetical protein